jgi:hypothetical protein
MRVALGMTTLLVALLAVGASGDEATNEAGTTTGQGGNASGGGAAEGGGGATPSPWASPRSWTPASPHECPTTLGADDLVAAGLEQLGLDRSLGIPTSLYQGAGGNLASDPARRSFFHRLEENPFEIPCCSGNLASRADLAVASDHPLTALVADAAASLDLTLTVGGTFPTDEDAPLAAALEAVFAGREYDKAAVAAATATLPKDLSRAVATILRGAVEARARRDEAVGVLVPGPQMTTVYKRGAASWVIGGGPGLSPDQPAYAGLFTATPEGYGKLYEGAARLAQAVDEAALGTLSPASEPFEFYLDTPRGAVLLRGGGDDVYDPSTDERLTRPLLLVVDTGGNDTYRIPAGATTSIEHAVAVHVDLGGDDTYAYVEEPSDKDIAGLLPSDADGRYAGDDNYGSYSLSRTARQGAGILGYGYLLDLGGGEDTYRSHRVSQGFGNFGVGILWDDGGDDSYEAENGAQGSGVVGIGLLHDGGGNDTYRSFGTSQGFGWVLSFGALHDASGDDRYELVVDSPVILFSPQTPGYANSSLGQGVAFG